MNEWAQQAAAQLSKDEAAQKQADEIYVRQRDQILGDAPRLWESLKEKLSADITAFNQHRSDYFKMTANFQGLPEITIESEKATLEARFDAAIPTMKYSTTHQSGPNSASTIQGSYNFDIERSSVWFKSQRATDVDSVAHEILNTMLRKG
jgi:hypothetical protein